MTDQLDFFRGQRDMFNGLDNMRQRPKHGEMRNSRLETEYPGSSKLVDAEGDVVYVGPLTAVTSTVEERWCDTCKKWVTCGRKSIIEHMLCYTCKRNWNEE